jgi:hypothetical protein
LSFFLIHQRQCRVGHDGFGDRRAVHDRVGQQRIALGVARAIGLHVDDRAIVNHRDRHALRLGIGHRGADARIDGGAAGKLGLGEGRGDQERQGKCGAHHVRQQHYYAERSRT